MGLERNSISEISIYALNIINILDVCGSAVKWQISGGSISAKHMILFVYLDVMLRETIGYRFLAYILYTTSTGFMLDLETHC